MDRQAVVSDSVSAMALGLASDLVSDLVSVILSDSVSESLFLQWVLPSQRLQGCNRVESESR